MSPDGIYVDIMVPEALAGLLRWLVAKIEKIAERVDHHDRVRDKDALDVLRLLRAVDTEELARRVRDLSLSELTATVTDEAIELIPQLLGDTGSEGVAMAVRAAGTAENPATIAGSLVALAEDVTTSLGRR